MKTFKYIIYILIQCTWGLPQTLAGLCVYLFFHGCPRFFFHGSIGTIWPNATSASLGLFIFVSRDCTPENTTKIKVHEYGHTIQSLILGPFYLPLAALPSMLWCFLPSCKRYRTSRNFSYYRFYTERNANFFGRLITHDSTME